MKVGVGIADVMCGMYAGRGDPGGPAAPRRHRRRPADRPRPARHPGRLAGQRGHQLPAVRARCRSGRAPSTRTSCPTRRSPAADGYVILAVGNDGQFQKWCRVRRCRRAGGGPALRHQQPAGRASARALRADAGLRARQDHARSGSTGLAALGVPCGPVNTLDQVFADPQVQARGMRIDLPHATRRGRHRARWSPTRSR